MRPAELGAAAWTIAASHCADPAMAWVYRDEARRQDLLSALFRLALRDVHRAGTVELARGHGRVIGVAAWLPPGTFPVPWTRQARSGPAFVRLLSSSPASTRRLLHFLSVATAAFPAQPSWQLNVLGVNPSAQGQGIGSALLRNGLDTVQRASGRLHLETWNEKNLRFYENFGFRVSPATAPSPPTDPAGGPSPAVERRRSHRRRCPRSARRFTAAAAGTVA